MANEEPDNASPESRYAGSSGSDPLLLQLRSDRRLGHEWDDWDGEALPSGGRFDAGAGLFFGVASAVGITFGAVGWLMVWLVAPRFTGVLAGLDVVLAVGILAAVLLWGSWLLAVALAMRRGRNRLPYRLAEGGMLPWAMPRLERAARLMGVSRDRCGNAMMRVFNRLTATRVRAGAEPDDLLILLPRCLSRDAMRSAMGISARYGVPVFVAARGRYARQMIAMRRPRAVIAVACERDLVSGVHDVAGRLPVLGTTLQLAEGPCRNTDFPVENLEDQVRTMLGLDDRDGDRRK